jgi:hypothetical protein
MSNTTIEEIKKERDLLLKELGSLRHILHGSWVERFSTCSRKECRCKQGELHGPRRYLVIREEGKQRQKYVPKSQVDPAQRGIAEYHRVGEIVDRITQLNLTLMKENAYED